MNSKSLSIRLEAHSRLPIYEQIVDQIRAQAVNRALQPGDQLPTMRALARELRINFNTVARAYRLLHQARVISTQQGRGSYVAEGIASPRGKRARRATLQHLTRRYINDALRLGYSTQDVSRLVSANLRRAPRPDGDPLD